ncbi:MAG: iron dependent repressor, metal binding and dimerization domain protein [Verrucomicrobiota bacterium]
MTQIAPIFLTLGCFACCLLLAGLLWPQRGWLARNQRRRAIAARVLREDALKHLCKVEAGGRRPTLLSVTGSLQTNPERAAALLREMEQQGLVSYSSGDLRLTASGRAAGIHVIRAHRLWECYLADQTGLKEGEWHARAEQREHLMTPLEADALAARLGNPTHDPHGDPIPTSGGLLEPDAGQALATLDIGQPAILVHIEDEPENLYSQLVAAGLRAGMTLRVLEKDPRWVRFIANGEEHVLAPILAHQLEVLPLADSDPQALAATLADFAPGQRVTVLGLARSCRGPERRRLLDLGFVAGTLVAVEMISPSGEPTAYRVRSTLIALHREQARLVLVKPITGEESCLI